MYRETERYTWTDANLKIFARVKAQFPETIPWRPGVHVLDLSAEGYIHHISYDNLTTKDIGPHVDSVKFSGGIVCGLSLLSPALMRLKFENPDQSTVLNGFSQQQDKQNLVIDLLLLPRSLYILR
jgi:alkylated DNA repair protein alkB family protein 7